MKLHSMKAAFDRMEEIPNGIRPLYDQLMKALGEVSERRHVYQLRMMTKQYAEKYHGA